MKYMPSVNLAKTSMNVIVIAIVVALIGQILTKFGVNTYIDIGLVKLFGLIIPIVVMIELGFRDVISKPKFEVNFNKIYKQIGVVLAIASLLFAVVIYFQGSLGKLAVASGWIDLLVLVYFIVEIFR